MNNPKSVTLLVLSLFTFILIILLGRHGRVHDITRLNKRSPNPLSVWNCLGCAKDQEEHDEDGSGRPGRQSEQVKKSWFGWRQKKQASTRQESTHGSETLQGQIPPRATTEQQEADKAEERGKSPMRASSELDVNESEREALSVMEALDKGFQRALLKGKVEEDAERSAAETERQLAALGLSPEEVRISTDKIAERIFDRAAEGTKGIID